MSRNRLQFSRSPSKGSAIISIEDETGRPIGSVGYCYEEADLKEYYVTRDIPNGPVEGTYITLNMEQKSKLNLNTSTRMVTLFMFGPHQSK